MKKTQTVLDEGETPMIVTSCSLNSISKFWCKMMHAPRHWRLTLIYKAMFNVIFLFFFFSFFFYKSIDGCMAFEAAYMLEKSVSVYLCYICLQYIYIYFKLDSNSIASRHHVVFQCRGLNCLFVCLVFFFPPSTLKESYWRFDTVGLRRWQDMNPRSSSSSSTFLETFFLHFSLCSSFSYLL